MPDFKFWDTQIAESACQAKDYPEVARQALSEMHRQVGELTIDEDGIAQRGLLIRHLVLPGGMAGTRQVMRFIAQEISTNSYVNLMSQYRPMFRADQYPEINRPITRAEYQEAIKAARDAGLTNVDIQGY